MRTTILTPLLSFLFLSPAWPAETILVADDWDAVGREPVKVFLDRLDERGIVRVVPPLQVRLEACIPPESFEIRKTDSALTLAAPDGRGLTYGLGRILRGLPWGQSDAAYFGPVGRFQPKLPVRGMYFATHFGNFYNAAPVEKVQRYVEDLALMGCNSLCVWFDMHHYRGMDDAAATGIVARLRAILHRANEVGIDAAFTSLANEGFANSPEDLRASWGQGWSHYHSEICPNKPGGLEKILAYRSQMLDAVKDLNIACFCVWPYDQGGCNCEKCVPWGGNGYMKASLAVGRLVKQRFPQAKIVLSTWEVGYHFSFDEEWDGLYAAVEANPGVFDYVMIEERQPRGYHEMLARRGAPGGLPILNFTEISMMRMFPWGGFGANLSLGMIQSMWAKYGARMSGGFPYSEGIYEDLNKFACLQLYWNPAQRVDDIVREYVEGYIGRKDADAVCAAIRQLDAQMGHGIDPTGLLAARKAHREGTPIEKLPAVYRVPKGPAAAKPYETLAAVAKTLPASVLASPRWKYVYLRAALDAELSTSGGRPTARSEDLFRQVRQLSYEGADANRCVSVPQIGKGR
ncbi:MAG TPA: hypothetical protein PLU30_21900 [Verrucomicrobiae bacterium]|nr:hypothetical protein [Verrucomicrobiae bacterium]